MKTCLAILSAALGCILLLTGCESDNASARTQEKSAVYASLKPWQKKYIDRGDIATGFTPDMVYLAIGHASKVRPTTSAEGGAGEVWVYSNFYVPANATHYRVAQGQAAATKSAGGPQRNAGMTRNQALGTATGAAEPSDLPSGTLTVEFHDGKVTKFELTPN